MVYQCVNNAIQYANHALTKVQSVNSAAQYDRLQYLLGRTILLSPAVRLLYAPRPTYTPNIRKRRRFYVSNPLESCIPNS